jgi:hypothetical protein
MNACSNSDLDPIDLGNSRCELTDPLDSGNVQYVWNRFDLNRLLFVWIRLIFVWNRLPFVNAREQIDEDIWNWKWT